MVAKVALNNDDAWLSLVERCVRDAEVAGSNPVASIERNSPHRKVGTISFYIHVLEVEPANSIEEDARSGAEGAERPGDVRLAPTEAKRRTQVQILSHRFFIYSVNFFVQTPI